MQAHHLLCCGGKKQPGNFANFLAEIRFDFSITDDLFQYGDFNHETSRPACMCSLMFSGFLHAHARRCMDEKAEIQIVLAEGGS